VRLVATDLDGTLLRSDGTVSDRTREVLAAVDDAGVPVVFVTGRPLRWMEDLWPLVGSHGMAVVSNGAVVFDVASREVRRTSGIEREAGLALVAAVRAAVPDAAFAVERLSGIAHERAFVDVDRVPDGSPVGSLDEVWDEAAVKLLVRYRDGDPDAVHEAVTAAVGEEAVATWSMKGLIEISAAGITKAVALAEVCDGLGVPAADVVAFGDMPNDVAMLEWAGTSYAMANAHPAVHEVADHVAPSNDDDGVAEVLAGLLDRGPSNGSGDRASGVMGA
jgi:Cof subfamily protein (haloacid dehalogenase superfamily)